MEGEKQLFSQGEILKNIAKYYSNLYSDTNMMMISIDIWKGQSYVSWMNLMQKVVQRIITENYCYKAVISMPKYKPPGCAGPAYWIL